MDLDAGRRLLACENLEMGTRLKLVVLLVIAGLALDHLAGLRPQREVIMEGVLRRPIGPPPLVEVELQSHRMRWRVDSKGRLFTGLHTGGPEVVWLERPDLPSPPQVQWLPQGRFRIHLELKASVTPRGAVVHFSGAPGQEVRSVSFALKSADAEKHYLEGWCGFLNLPAAPTLPGHKSPVRNIQFSASSQEPEETDMLETGLPTSVEAETEALARSALEKINLLPVRELLARSRAIQARPGSSRRPLAGLLAAMAQRRLHLLSFLGRSLSHEGSLSSDDSARSRSISEE